MNPNKTSPVELARDFAEQAIQACILTGVSSPLLTPLDDEKTQELAELYAAEVIGTITPAQSHRIETLTAALS